MSMHMTEPEVKNVDAHVEQMLDWAQANQADAEQLSYDAVRLLSCTEDRLEKAKNQGFYKRCWSRFNGDAASAERANSGDMIQMQKMSLRYINMLQEQQLMMAHSMLSIKNNLFSLAVKEEETRSLVTLLANNTLNRFKKLEHRVDQLEVTTSLQGWLLALEEREYDEKISAEYMRLLRVINDFYSLKSDGWNYNDLMFMRKAIRTVGIDPKRKISLNVLIDTLVDEIQQECVGFEFYNDSISQFKPDVVDDYSQFAVDNISSQAFCTIHGLQVKYMDRLDVVEVFTGQIQMTKSEALKLLLKRSIANMGIDLDYQFPLAETAIEILGCIRLVEKLATQHFDVPEERESASVEVESICVDEITNQNEEPSVELEKKYVEEIGGKKVDISNIILASWKRSKLTVEQNKSQEDTASMLLGILKSVFSSTCSIVSAGNGYIALLDNSLLSSTNLMDWQKRREFSGTSGKIVKAGGKFFCLQGAEVLCSDEGISWEELVVSTQISGNNISYKNVFHNGKQWFVIGEHSSEYCYVEKSFFGKSDKTGTYSSAVIFAGEQLSSLKPYSFTQGFHKFDVLGACLCGEKIVALLTHTDRVDEMKVVTSSDGFSWKTMNINAEDTVYHEIFSHDGKCFVTSHSELFEFLPITGKLKAVHGKLPGVARDTYSFPDRGVIFCCNSSDNNPLMMSCDLRKWINIDSPFKKIESLVYTGETLVIANGDEVAYRNMR